MAAAEMKAPHLENDPPVPFPMGCLLLAPLERREQCVCVCVCVSVCVFVCVCVTAEDDTIGGVKMFHLRSNLFLHGRLQCDRGGCSFCDVNSGATTSRELCSAAECRAIGC